MSETKSKWFNWIRDIIVMALIVIGIFAWQSRHLLDDDGSVTVPVQNLVSLDGEVIPMLSEDKPTLVYFFAPWCGVCRLSINNLDYLNSDNVNVVRVALDFRSIEEVQSFVDDNDVQGDVLLGRDELKQQFSIRGYPTYYLVDEQQTIINSAMGYSTALGLKLTELLHN